MTQGNSGLYSTTSALYPKLTGDRHFHTDSGFKVQGTQSQDSGTQ